MSTIPFLKDIDNNWTDITTDIFSLFTMNDTIEIYIPYIESQFFELLIDVNGDTVIDSSFNNKGIRLDRYKLTTNITLNQNSKYYVRALDQKATVHIKPIEVIPTQLSDVENLRRDRVIGLFNRVKVATTRKEFDNQLSNDRQPLFWDQKILGGATSTLQPSNSALDLTVNNNGDRFLRQLKQYILYQSGYAKGADLTYTPDENSNEVYFILRSGSGALVNDPLWYAPKSEKRIPQSQWNIDKLDGTGISGVTLDKTKSNIFVMSLEWLSVGAVLYGFEIDGELKLCHAEFNANKITGAYMTTANLPARYDLVSVVDGAEQYIGYGDDSNGVFVMYKTPNQNATLKQICTNVYTEGGETNPLGIPFNPASGVTRVSLGVGLSFTIAIQHRLTYQGVDNLTVPALTNRVQFDPKELIVGSTESDLFIEVIYNPIVNGGTFNQYIQDGNYSAFNINTAVTSLTGGHRVRSKYVYATAGLGQQGDISAGEASEIASKLPYGIGIDGDAPIPLAFRITNIGGSITDVDYSFLYEQI